jgi:ABC-type transport system substrate-binding protein
VTIGLDADLVFPYENIDGARLPASLNPLRHGAVAPEIARLVVPGVYRLDGTNGMLTPWLVEQIPRVSNGGVEIDDDGAVTVTYEVRDEAVWEDGTPVTAADLAFTHELITQAAPDFVVDESLREIHDLVEPGSLIVDGKTLQLGLIAPDSRYERLFEWIVPAHAVDAATFG